METTFVVIFKTVNTIHSQGTTKTSGKKYLTINAKNEDNAIEEVKRRLEVRTQYNHVSLIVLDVIEKHGRAENSKEGNLYYVTYTERILTNGQGSINNVVKVRSSDIQGAHMHLERILESFRSIHSDKEFVLQKHLTYEGL